MPAIALVAAIIAFLMAGLILAGALLGNIAYLPFALVPLVAGIGILRRRMWSAYGLALFLGMQLLLLPLIADRSQGADLAAKIGALVSSGLSLILSVLFFFAGRSLAKTGSPAGHPLPWIALSVLVTFPLFFVEPFVNPTGSMEDTLLIGDRILVRLIPRLKPDRGDLIVFHFPVDRHQTFIKRIIGMPGDHIRIADKIVYRNGAMLQEPYVRHKAGYPDSYRDNFPGGESAVSMLPTAQAMLKTNVVNGEVVVPAESYFVLGDNRDNSLDSRYWGFVGFQDLIGKPLLVYDSVESSTANEPGSSPVPSRRRWGRLFHLL